MSDGGAIVERVSTLMPGDWVEVLPATEILATLDTDQALDGLPFMPEMLPHAGTRRRVLMRASRTCINPPVVPFPVLKDTVVLDVAPCDGASHAGCQLGCMFLWKEAWLRHAPAGDRPDAPGRSDVPIAAVELRSTAPDDPERYMCQATALPAATEPGPPMWQPAQYLRFLRDRTLSLPQLLVQFGRPVVRRVRWALERVVRAVRRTGPAAPVATPPMHLGLQAGEWVEVRSRDEIRTTLDAHGRTRGLAFSTDQYRLSGRRLRVLRRIEKVVVEATGRLQTVNDTVILEGSMCDRYRGCARGMPILWREAWLKRVDGEAREG